MTCFQRLLPVNQKDLTILKNQTVVLAILVRPIKIMGYYVLYVEIKAQLKKGIALLLFVMERVQWVILCGLVFLFLS